MTKGQSDVCLFCKSSADIYKYVLRETPLFRILCDNHPLIEGHIIIVPKDHVPCIGAYSDKTFRAFEKLYHEFSDFISKEYGKVSSFEHGVLGQTIFHSHVHMLPWQGTPEKIITEGANHFEPLYKMQDLRKGYQHTRGYLFFAIGRAMYLADPELASPRFFRDRYAKALGSNNRMDWKLAQQDKNLLNIFGKENQEVLKKWTAYSA